MGHSNFIWFYHIYFQHLSKKKKNSYLLSSFFFFLGFCSSSLCCYLYGWFVNWCESCLIFPFFLKEMVMGWFDLSMVWLVSSLWVRHNQMVIFFYFVWLMTGKSFYYLKFLILFNIILRCLLWYILFRWLLSIQNNTLSIPYYWSCLETPTF